MIIPDTSIWIEFFKANPTIHMALTNLMEERFVIALECVFAELLQGAKNKEVSIIEQFWFYLPKIESENIFIEAGIYSSKHKLISQGVGLIDAVLIVSAIKTKSAIWTLDKKLKRCVPNDLLFPKTIY